MPHIFVSYVRDNQEVIDRLTRDLRARGVNVWLDRDRIEPGQRWRDAIKNAIRSGALFLACFSPEYAKRDRTHMNEELTLAIDELRARSTDRTWFVPLILTGGEVPNRSIGAGESLRDLQWLDVSQDWGEAINRLVQVARKADAAFPVPYREPKPPPAPPSPETGFRNVEEVHQWLQTASPERLAVAIRETRLQKDALYKQLRERLLAHEIMYRADWPEEDQEAMSEVEGLEAQIELMEAGLKTPSV